MNLFIKKSTINILVFLITISAFSQIRQDNAGIDQIPTFGAIGNATTVNNLGSQNTDLIKADIYFYPTYNNTAVIETTTNRKYTISNINLNVYTNRFDSKMPGDSVYVFDNKSIKSIKINNKRYVAYLDSESDKYTMFQVIYESDKFSLLRKDKIISKEIRDPLNINPPKMSYVKVVNYFVKKEDGIENISLKKKSILEVLKDKKSKVSNYAKKYKLSYKNENDLQKLFKYYGSL